MPRSPRSVLSRCVSPGRGSGSMVQTAPPPSRDRLLPALAQQVVGAHPQVQAVLELDPDDVVRRRGDRQHRARIARAAGLDAARDADDADLARRRRDGGAHFGGAQRGKFAGFAHRTGFQRVDLRFECGAAAIRVRPLNGVCARNAPALPSANRFGDCVAGMRALTRAWKLA